MINNQSTKANLKCPFCGHTQEVAIPQTSCLALHKCEQCQKLISMPKESTNCCVICEYSDTKCPVAHQGVANQSKTPQTTKESKLSTGQVILWILAALIIFVLASIFGWKVLYGIIIPQTSNLATFSTLGILAFAFIAGLIANFGPCSLGVLPAYMSFYLGMPDPWERSDSTGDEGPRKSRQVGKRGREEKHSPIKKSIKLGAIASLGVFSFFIVLGVLFATIGTFLVGFASQLKFVVAFLILFIGIAFLRGKSMTIPFLGSFRDRVNKMSRGRSQSLSLFGFGVVYGAGGLMCFLPIFLPLVFFPLIGGEFLVSITSFIIFSLAQALFLIAVTVFIGQGKQTFFKTMIGKAETMKKVAGGILILTSVWMFAIFLIWGM